MAMKTQISCISTDSGNCSPSLDPSSAYPQGESYFVDESNSDGLIYLNSDQVRAKIVSLADHILSSNEFDELNDQLEKEVTQLVAYLSEIALFADDYDYKSVPANGYRTTLRLFARMLQITGTLMSRRSRVEQFIQTIALFNPILLSTINLRVKQLNGTDDDTTHRDIIILLLKSSPDIMKVTLNGKYLAMNLPAFKKSFKFLVRSFAIASPTYSAGKKIKTHKFDRNAALFIDTITNTDLNRLPEYRGLLDTAIPRFTSSLIRSAMKPLKCSIKRYPKQAIASYYKIHVTADGARLIKRDTPVMRRADFSVLKNQSTSLTSKKMSSDSGKLLLFLHGGAFIGPPASCLNDWYVKDFTCASRDLTLINLDYPLSPEYRFPVAIESIVDFYLWLTNQHEQVKDILGFQPKQIILSGDSAGGNLAASLLVVLNEIRRDINLSIDNISIRMPSSLALFMPKMTLQLKFFPSMIYCLFDPILSTIVMSRVGEIHVPLRRKDAATGQWILVTGRHSKDIKINDVYDADELEHDVTDEKLPANYFTRNDYEFLPSIYHSPLSYPHLKELAGVKLVVLTTTFCSLMDESIEIVRRWSGQKSLYVVDPSFHGAYGCSIVMPKKVTSMMDACAAAIQDACSQPEHL